VIWNSGFFTPFGHSRKVFDVLEEFLERFDGYNDSGFSPALFVMY
jgi:hypothetical protein